jgi:cytochrome P450
MINLFDASARLNEGLAFRQARGLGPIFYCPTNRAWMVTDSAVGQKILKDRAFQMYPSGDHSARDGTVQPATAVAHIGCPASLSSYTVQSASSTQHQFLRSLIDPPLKLRQNGTLASQVDSILESLLVKVRPQDELEFVSQVAFPLSYGSLCALLGWPSALTKETVHWVGWIWRSLSGLAAPQFGAQGWERLGKLVALHMGEMSGRSMITKNLAEQVQLAGQPCEVTVANVVNLLFLGYETTKQALTLGVKVLLEHPDRWRALGTGELRPEAVVEEVLRFTSPARAIWRYAHRDVQIGSHQLKEGQKVWIWLAAINRDPVRFSDPEVFSPGLAERKAAVNLTFGAGAHACPGMQLARYSLKGAFLRLAQAFPTWEIRQVGAPISVPFLNGVQTLDLIRR